MFTLNLNSVNAVTGSVMAQPLADLRGLRGPCLQNLAPNEFQKRPFGTTRMQETFLAAGCIYIAHKKQTTDEPVPERKNQSGFY